MVKLVPDDYPATECAKDMEAGLNHFGDTGDPHMDAVLAREGVVMLPCPACAASRLRLHTLTIEKRGDRFLVTA